MQLTNDQLEQYEKNGYLVIDNVISDSLCSTLQAEVDKIIETQLIDRFYKDFPEFPILSAMNVFSNEEDVDKFVASASDINIFYDKSLSKSDELREKIKKNIKERRELIKPYLNKIAYALHALNPTFKDVTFSDNVQGIFKSLDYKKPIVCQSMYILKRLFTNKEASGHQDATYINLKSPEKLGTLWIAMEDQTAENGCLKFVPGSQRDGLLQSFIKNPKKKEDELERDWEQVDKGKRFVYTKPPISDYKDEDFVTVPVKRGSALLFNGLVVHKSTETEKPMSRETYVFHVYDTQDNEFKNENWMNYSESTFIPLY